MESPIEVLGIYLHLAQASAQRRRPHARDRLLVVAAVVAAQQGLRRIAALCRHKILQHNPHHMVSRWPTVEVALDDQDFQHFMRHLVRQYPAEKAERMLESLGVERGQERAAYYSDEEFAAALLGYDLHQLESLAGEDDH
jgi:hypothetical protein